MIVIYVGDAKDVVKRIRSDHCTGNVESSALRKSVAIAKDYRIKSTKRLSGSTRLRIDLPVPREGETCVSNYIRLGEWRFVLCESTTEAKDFQWYAIYQLKPLLNKTYKSWDQENLHRYQDLLQRLNRSPALTCEQLRGIHSGPGVYSLYHPQKPRGR